MLWPTTVGARLSWDLYIQLMFRFRKYQGYVIMHVKDVTFLLLKLNNEIVHGAIGFDSTDWRLGVLFWNYRRSDSWVIVLDFLSNLSIYAVAGFAADGMLYTYDSVSMLIILFTTILRFCSVFITGNAFTATKRSHLCSLHLGFVFHHGLVAVYEKFHAINYWFVGIAEYHFNSCIYFGVSHFVDYYRMRVASFEATWFRVYIVFCNKVLLHASACSFIASLEMSRFV